MSNKLKLGLFIVALIFTIMIATAPPRQGEHGSLIDSLKRRVYQAERERDKALQEAKEKDILASTWFAEAEKLRKQKTVYVTKYKNEVKRIDSLSDPRLDSILRAIYPER